MNFDDFEFNRIELNEDLIREYKNESQFMEICVELFKVIGHLTILISNISKQDDAGNIIKLNKNEAIIVGNLIRLSKLMIAFIQQTCEKRREITDILIRCIFETTINLNYFLKNKNNEAIFEDYILSSLSTELKLYNDITKNINDRGSILPIEERMLESIVSSVNDSGFDIKKIDTKRKYIKIFDKAKDVFNERSYLYYISLPSHSIHGNWQDLITHHLTCEDELFLPKNNWSIPRPQQINSAVFIIIEFLLEYISFALEPCQEREYLIWELFYHREINIKLNDLHEEFLVRKQNELKEKK